MVQIDYTTLGAAQLRRPLDGGRGHHGPVLARSAPGLLFLSPTNPAWHIRLAHPRGRPSWPTPAWPLCTARRRQRRADRDGGVVARPAPGLLFLSPTNPAWPTRSSGRPGGCERHEGEHVVVLGRAGSPL